MGYFEEMLSISTARLYQRLFWRKNWNLLCLAWILHIHADNSINCWGHQLLLLTEMDDQQPNFTADLRQEQHNHHVPTLRP